jgi:predicted AAA+ superfamily ATPase
MGGLKQEVLLDGDKFFVEFKGALTEQYVLQQIKTVSDMGVYYWTNNRNTAEIDFLLDNGNTIIPLEVKAETNLHSKSLKAFADKYEIPLSVRTSMSDYKREDRLLNLPLYAISELDKNL